MPEWIWASIVAVAGIVGYWLRGFIDEWFTKRKTARGDLLRQREALRAFLGKYRGHNEWLVVFATTRQAEAGPTKESLERAQSIADWVRENAHAFPEARRGPLYFIANSSQHLAAGHRSRLETMYKDGRDGYTRLYEAWETLERFEKDLTRRLTG